MHRAIPALLLLLILMLHPAAATPGKSCDIPPKTPSILFIGNSYTYTNDLPAILDKLLKAGGHPAQVDSFTRGAASLGTLYNSPDLQKGRHLLTTGNYTWVILQDQSQTPSLIPEETLRFAKQWSELAQQHNTSVIFFLTWAHATSNTANRPELIQDMQDKTTRTYCQAAIDNNATIAPVGEAWRAWYNKFPTKPLHGSDGSHPNTSGSYLAACIFYQTITGESPVGLPGVKGIRSGSLRELQQTTQRTASSFSPETILNQASAANDTLPSAQDCRDWLTKGIKLRDIQEKLGKPTHITKQDGTTTYQFTLRDNGELCIYCKGRIPYSATLRTQENSMAGIIALK